MKIKRRIHIHIHRDEAPDLRALYDELAERMLAALAEARAAEGKTGDREWNEEDHPRAPDGRFGNKAGEHNGAAEKPTAADLKETIPKRRLRELLESGHAFTKEELMQAAGIEKESTFVSFLGFMRNPKHAGPKGALQIKKNSDGTFQVVMADGKPAPAPEKPKEAPKPTPAPSPSPSPAPAPTPAPSPAPAPAEGVSEADAADWWQGKDVATRQAILQAVGYNMHEAYLRYSLPWQSLAQNKREEIKEQYATLLAAHAKSRADRRARIEQAKALKPWKDAATIAELSQRAVAEGYVDAADFGKLDVAYANEAMRSYAEHLVEFPALRTGPRGGWYVGSGSGWRKHYVETMMPATIERLRLRNPNATPEQLAKSATFYIAPPRISQKAWAQAWDYGHSGTGMRAVTLTEKHMTAKNKTAMDADLKSSVMTGWHPTGCDTVKSIMDHEMGHQLDYLLGARSDPEIAALEREASRPLSGSALAGHSRKEVVRANLSAYAATNRAEFIAEAWAEYKNNPEPRPIAKAVGERIKALYAAKFSNA